MKPRERGFIEGFFILLSSNEECINKQRYLDRYYSGVTPPSGRPPVALQFLYGIATVGGSIPR